jgi:hypothetical protein
MSKSAASPTARVEGARPVHACEQPSKHLTGTPVRHRVDRRFRRPTSSSTPTYRPFGASLRRASLRLRLTFLPLCRFAASPLPSSPPHAAATHAAAARLATDLSFLALPLQFHR